MQFGFGFCDRIALLFELASYNLFIIFELIICSCNSQLKMLIYCLILLYGIFYLNFVLFVIPLLFCDMNYVCFVKGFVYWIVGNGANGFMTLKLLSTSQPQLQDPLIYPKELNRSLPVLGIYNLRQYSWRKCLSSKNWAAISAISETSLK